MVALNPRAASFTPFTSCTSSRWDELSSVNNDLASETETTEGQQESTTTPLSKRDSSRGATSSQGSKSSAQKDLGNCLPRGNSKQSKVDHRSDSAKLSSVEEKQPPAIVSSSMASTPVAKARYRVPESGKPPAIVRSEWGIVPDTPPIRPRADTPLMEPMEPNTYPHVPLDLSDASYMAYFPNFYTSRYPNLAPSMDFQQPHQQHNVYAPMVHQSNDLQQMGSHSNVLASTSHHPMGSPHMSFHPTASQPMHHHPNPYSTMPPHQMEALQMGHYPAVSLSMAQHHALPSPMGHHSAVSSLTQQRAVSSPLGPHREVSLSTAQHRVPSWSAAQHRRIPSLKLQPMHSAGHTAAARTWRRHSFNIEPSMARNSTMPEYPITAPMVPIDQPHHSTGLQLSNSSQLTGGFRQPAAMPMMRTVHQHELHPGYGMSFGRRSGERETMPAQSHKCGAEPNKTDTTFYRSPPQNFHNLAPMMHHPPAPAPMLGTWAWHETGFQVPPSERSFPHSYQVSPPIGMHAHGPPQSTEQSSPHSQQPSPPGAKSKPGRARKRGAPRPNPNGRVLFDWTDGRQNQNRPSQGAETIPHQDGPHSLRQSGDARNYFGDPQYNFGGPSHNQGGYSHLQEGQSNHHAGHRYSSGVQGFGQVVQHSNSGHQGISQSDRRYSSGPQGFGQGGFQYSSGGHGLAQGGMQYNSGFQEHAQMGQQSIPTGHPQNQHNRRMSGQSQVSGGHGMLGKEPCNAKDDQKSHLGYVQKCSDVDKQAHQGFPNAASAERVPLPVRSNSSGAPLYPHAGNFLIERRGTHQQDVQSMFAQIPQFPPRESRRQADVEREPQFQHRPRTSTDSSEDYIIHTYAPGDGSSAQTGAGANRDGETAIAGEDAPTRDPITGLTRRQMEKSTARAKPSADVTQSQTIQTQTVRSQTALGGQEAGNAGSPDNDSDSTTIVPESLVSQHSSPEASSPHAMTAKDLQWMHELELQFRQNAAQIVSQAANQSPPTFVADESDFPALPGSQHPGPPTQSRQSLKAQKSQNTSTSSTKDKALIPTRPVVPAVPLLPQQSASQQSQTPTPKSATSTSAPQPALPLSSTAVPSGQAHGQACRLPSPDVLEVKSSAPTLTRRRSSDSAKSGDSIAQGSKSGVTSKSGARLHHTELTSQPTTSRKPSPSPPRTIAYHHTATSRAAPDLHTDSITEFPPLGVSTASNSSSGSSSKSAQKQPPKNKQPRKNKQPPKTKQPPPNDTVQQNTQPQPNPQLEQKKQPQEEQSEKQQPQKEQSVSDMATENVSDALPGLGQTKKPELNQQDSAEKVIESTKTGQIVDMPSQSETSTAKVPDSPQEPMQSQDPELGDKSTSLEKPHESTNTDPDPKDATSIKPVSSIAAPSSSTNVAHNPRAPLNTAPPHNYTPTQWKAVNTIRERLHQLSSIKRNKNEKVVYMDIMDHIWAQFQRVNAAEMVKPSFRKKKTMLRLVAEYCQAYTEKTEEELDEEMKLMWVPNRPGVDFDLPQEEMDRMLGRWP
ncbi:hypothetical protein K402DRAFT_467103 [Aulographum hederae CBS 113979]|uniref:Uncharacterized protein n=1 Tax=Aulographum hederae CBS 113979 TaxID=1176131 RepID=A0A6G1GLY9_9PEZI|nr:hypothetical protein K402DRAFT_467103 [Aulographum hederae CBS 113979]